MSRKILLKKATRIEGNADIDIEVSNGRIKAARFLVREFRGFERFVRDRRMEYAPQLVSRICGLCSCAHQVAGFRAIENALGLTVPSSVEALRDIIVLGEWISSHALSYFFLCLPDAVEARGGIFDLMANHPEIAGDAFFLREKGLKISETIGKRAVHPVSMGIGRFLTPPTAEDIAAVKRLAEAVRDRVARLIPKVTDFRNGDDAIVFPEDIQLNFLTFQGMSQEGRFNVFDRDGELVQTFDPASFEESVDEIHTDWTFSKVPYLRQFGFPEGILLVGPLSRRFLDDGILSDPQIAAFGLSERLRDPRKLTLESFDICRILEILWASKRILALLEKVDLHDAGEIPDYTVNGRGIGVLEAPRGVLVHSYLIKEGYIEKMRLLVATQFNNAYINLLITDLAQKYMEDGGLSPTGERLIGRCVRLLDPCLSCATH